MGPKVFLSFAIRHKALVDLFRRQASSSRSALTFRDYSIKEPVEGAWKPRAENLIRESTVTVCLIGDTTWQSEPVNWEIRRSAALGKRVLAVYLQPGALQLPEALTEIGVTPMPWNLNAILRELNSEQHRH